MSPTVNLSKLSARHLKKILLLVYRFLDTNCFYFRRL